jgi:uncharacterized protein YndB with AHSA1/START domain
MTTQQPVRQLQASIDIDAPPDRVWRVISDVRSTPQWSPECTRVVPVGAIRKGSWMLGLNRRNATRWATLSQVTRYEPDQEIGWVVRTNGAIWTYHLEAIADGVRLVETRDTPNGVGAIARWFTRAFLGGETGHDDELETGMASGLQRIKAIVEG